MSILTIPATYIKGFINKGHSRSVSAKKNIIFSFLIKGGSVAISLILLPLTFQYVNPTQYGIWLTLSSVISWFAFFDIGFGNGLRNKFTEAVAKGEHTLARIYVSTTYAILALIITVVLIIFFCINPFLNWAGILNTSPTMMGELRTLALIVFVFFCIQFVLQLLITILTANQEPAKASFLNFLGSLFSLIVIFILIKTTKGNLVYLGLALSATPVAVLAISSIWFFSTAYRKYIPSIKYVRFEYAKNLMSVGTKFFIIQIGALILLQTDNIIIVQLFGSEAVTTYNIAYKPFSVIILVFSIIMAPLWSAFTDAYAKKDFDWISRLFYKMQKVFLVIVLLSAILLLSSPILFKLWLGNKVNIPFYLSTTVAIYAVANSWLMIPCFLLNGIGKIKLQLILYLFCIVINIPLCFLLGRFFGLPGVAISNTVILVAMSILLSIQSKKIINNTATGVWAQ
jgi:O-antigen/teichoic acid export membrane protein